MKSAAQQRCACDVLNRRESNGIPRYGVWRTTGRLLRTLVALVAGVIGYLSLLPPPTTLFWFVRLGVTEWGYWLAPLILVPLLRPLRRVLGWSAWLLSLAALVAQLPLLQALNVARALPAQLTAAFGADNPLGSGTSGSVPFSVGVLFRRSGIARVAPRRLVYVERSDQTLHLDLYSPSNTSVPAPLVIVIHGGSWQSGDSEQLSGLNAYLAERGYAVASLDYRLAPRYPFPAARDDVVAAIAYLTSHAQELGVDAQRIVLLGRSAGAQLALLVGYTLPNPAIRGVVSLYGPTDMSWGYEHPANPWVIDSQSILEAYLGGTPTQVPQTYQDASPTRFVTASSPPTLLIHGGSDEMVFVDNSRRLVEQLATAQRPHLLVELPWASHGCDANLNGPSGQISTYATEYFVHAVTR